MSKIKAVLNISRADGSFGANVVIREDGSVQTFGEHDLAIAGIALALRALPDEPR